MIDDQDSEDFGDIDDATMDAYFDSKGESLSEDKEEEKEEVKSPDPKNAQEPQGTPNSYEAKLEELTKGYNKVLAELEAERSYRKKQETPEEAPLDYDSSPLEYLKNQQEELAKQFEYSRAQHEYKQQEESLVNRYMASARDFTAATPDFKQAYDFAVGNREKELISIGYTPEQARQTTLQDEYAIVNNALNTGVNPAELIYSLAVQRGYAPLKAAKPEPVKAEVIKKGQKATKTLDTVGRTPPEDDMEDEMASMMNLEGADFEAAWKKFAKKSKNR